MPAEPAADADERPDATEGGGAPEHFDEGVYVSGPFGRSISTVQGLTVDLVVGTGRADDKREFLVPYLDVELDGEFFGSFVENERDDDGDGSIQAPAEDAAETADHSVSLTLSFDNVAFLIERTAKRYRKLMRSLEGMSRGGLTPVPGRIDYSIRALRKASFELAATAEEMQALLTPSDQLPPDPDPGHDDG